MKIINIKSIKLIIHLKLYKVINKIFQYFAATFNINTFLLVTVSKTYFINSFEYVEQMKFYTTV